MTQMEIRAFAVLYFVKKEKDRQAFKISLEKDPENLQETLDSNPSHQSQELYDSNKKQLEKIEKRRNERTNL